MLFEKKVECLSTVLEGSVLDLIEQYGISKRESLTQTLVSYINLLCPPLTSNNTSELITNLVHVRSHLCKKHTRSTANAKFTTLRSFIAHLINEGRLSRIDSLPDRPSTNDRYELYRNERIPPDALHKIKVELNAEEEFELILVSSCTPEIAKRLRQHINSFKQKKHHRSPLAQFLTQISTYEPEWHLYPKIIQGELIKFRANTLNDKQRNTAYGNFQNVKNAISVLIEHRLLPSDTDLPDNLRRCTNTQKVRNDNPLICAPNIYHDGNKQSFINSTTFIEDLIDSISTNLDSLVTEAQTIVHAGYHHFLDRRDVVGRSQQHEFFNHPELLVDKFDGSHSRSKINPFYSEHPLRHENLTAYYNHHFDSLARNETPHKMDDLRTNNEVLKHLGLVPLVASAMQIIIVEELGINPYSLYRVKISSEGHGHEFVQITDEGSVRLKALKPRARNVRTRNTKSSLAPLSCIEAQSIDAATCLKMALEMTRKTRDVTGRSELWTCLSHLGVTCPKPETFQNNFNKIRKKAAAHNPVINDATLKKVRTSKGVLIYLESRGDAIKTASYFGNAVKTTLDRYIPPYLTELIYRVKIRAFQNILLFMAVATSDSPAESLHMDPNDFDAQIKKAFNNPDMGGNLYEKLTTPPSFNEAKNTKYFCVSQKNIELALTYVIDGEDNELVRDCHRVLEKIADGPVIMKQLLRKAQISVEQNK